MHQLPAWDEVSIDPDHSNASRHRYSSTGSNGRASVPGPARAKPTLGQYLNESRDSDNRNAGYQGVSDGRKGGFLDRDSVFDEFKYREVCLNAASRTKMVTTFLSKIKDHILKEASLEWEVSSLFWWFVDIFAYCLHYICYSRL